MSRVGIELSLYDVLIDRAPISKAKIATHVPGLDLIVSDANLSGVELELGQAQGRSFRLRDGLSQLEAGYGFVLIDCPPSLNLLTVNAMAASDRVLVPLQSEFFALEGLTQLMRTIDLVKVSLNPKLEIEGIVLTMYDKRNALSQQVERDVREHFKQKVFETVIPRNVRVSEAPSFGKPVILYDFKSTGAQAYIQLAKEFIARMKNTSHQTKIEV